jgi:peptidoglycan/xylan/chitin deacetylase (PgdA/CDA1 family)
LLRIVSLLVPKHFDSRVQAKIALPLDSSFFSPFMLSLPLEWISKHHGQPQLSVLTFHRVFPEQDSLFASEPCARRFPTWLKTWARWVRFLPLAEAVQRLRAGTLPARAACITFDDGYADNLEVAAPILSSLGIPATFFIATDFMDGGMMFNDRVIEAFRQHQGSHLDLTPLGLGIWPTATPKDRASAIDQVLIGKGVKYLPYAERERVTMSIAQCAGANLDPHPMMTEAQVKKLAAMGFEIGAHTQSHPILREIPDARARIEIEQSRARLKAITGQPIDVFAYPNGKPNEDYDLRHTKMVEAAGFIGAVATIPGAAAQGADYYQIPRFTPWHGESWKSAAQLMRNYRTPIAALR